MVTLVLVLSLALSLCERIAKGPKSSDQSTGQQLGNSASRERDFDATGFDAAEQRHERRLTLSAAWAPSAPRPDGDVPSDGSILTVAPFIVAASRIAPGSAKNLESR